MDNKKWIPPFRCRWFGHRYKETGEFVTFLNIGNHVFESEIEVCKNCGCGRVLEFGGYHKYAPSAVEKYFLELKAEAEKKIVKMK